jgi:hypothetical protein
MRINGIGKHVKKTVINKNTFLPHISDMAPMSGALRKESIPYSNENNNKYYYFCYFLR